MNPRTIPLLWSLPFAILFSIIFFEEKIALNLVLYGTLLGTALLLLNPEAIQRWKVRLMAAGNLFSGFFVLVHASDASRWAYLLTFMAFAGIVLSPHFRSLPAAIGAALSQVFTLPISLIESIPHLFPRNLRKVSTLKKAGFIVVPIGVTFVFLLLFAGGNPRFSSLIEDGFSFFDNWGLWLSSSSAPAHVVLMGLGFLLTAAFLFQEFYWPILYMDLKAKTQLNRQRKPRKKFRFAALRREYRTALLLVVAVNFLTLVNNIIDINWLWFNFEFGDPYELYQFVHAGTFTLITSILLAMGIMFYFFRGNLNFFSGNKWLRYGCYFWIGQNLILVASVMIRNYHYISYWSLTNKRIGVIFFLAMTAIGLVTLFFKIKNRKTAYHVVRVNAWVGYAMLLLLAVIDWDGVIARYNLRDTGREGLDVALLLNLSDKTLPILYDHKEAFQGKTVRLGERFLGNGYQIPADEALYNRIQDFLDDKTERGVWSWNLADAKAQERLENWVGDELAVPTPQNPLTSSK